MCRKQAARDGCRTQEAPEELFFLHVKFAPSSSIKKMLSCLEICAGILQTSMIDFCFTELLAFIGTNILRGSKSDVLFHWAVVAHCTVRDFDYPINEPRAHQLYSFLCVNRPISPANFAS